MAKPFIASEMPEPIDNTVYHKAKAGFGTNNYDLSLYPGSGFRGFRLIEAGSPSPGLPLNEIVANINGWVLTWAVLAGLAALAYKFWAPTSCTVNIVSRTMSTIVNSWLLASFVIPKLLDGDPRVHPINVFGRSPLYEYYFQAVLGYFTLDSILEVYNKNHLSLLHHLLCFSVYFLVIYPRPFLQHYALFFLFFELSTPFIHIRWLFRHFGMDKKHPCVYRGLLKAVFGTFTIVRILVGIPMAYKWVRDVFFVYHYSPAGYLPDQRILNYVLLVLTSLTVLNIYWWIIMIKIGFCSKEKTDISLTKKEIIDLEK